jgi:hypothetical protein
MTEQEKHVIRCALADLCGAMQAKQQDDIHVHDWEAHKSSIHELAETFGLWSDVPEDCK